MNQPKISHPGCETCPICQHETLPRIKVDSHATGRMCCECKTIVDRSGKVELVGKVEQSQSKRGPQIL